MEAQTLKKSEGWLPLAVECLFYLSLLFSFAVLELVGLSACGGCAPFSFAASILLCLNG